MLAGAQPRQLPPAAFADPKRTPADAQRVRVMKDDDLVVRSQSQIALDARAKPERGSERDQAVLGKARAVMETAVGEPPRAWVQRVRR